MTQDTIKSMIAGGIAGGITRLIASPFDVVKIRFQLDVQPKISETSRSKIPWTKNLIGRTLRDLYFEEGVRTFWRGNVAATYLWVSYSAAQFGCYRFLSEISEKNLPDSKHSGWMHGLNGGIAGIVATGVTYPFDMIRTVFAAQGVPKAYPTMTSLVKKTWKADGIQGFYRGLTPAVYQIGPYMAISFWVYENTRRCPYFSSPSSPVATALAGGFAGFISKLAVYPLDTMKKRMQMHGHERDQKYSQIPKYRNFIHCLRHIVKTEGLLALYRGTVPSLFKSIVAHSTTFSVYEFSRLAMDKVY